MTAPATCTRCGAPTGASYRVCDTCLAADVERECAEQGVPFLVDDPVVLRKVATIVNAAATPEQVA